MISTAALLRNETDPTASPIFWRALADSVPDILLLVDPSATIVYVNRVPEGNQSAGVVGSSVFEYVPPESRAELKLSLADIFRGGAARMREQRGIHADGTERWYAIHSGPVSIDGKVVAAIIAARDVTEAKEAKMQLADSEARCRILLDHAPEAIVVFDADLGHFVDANPTACEMFGLSLDELLHSNPAALSPCLQKNGLESASEARRYIEQALGGSAPIFSWTHSGPRGEEIECEIRLVRLPAGTRRLVRGSVTDVTERRRTEAQLRESQKMDALGKLAAGIAHDFNNLLTVISCTAQCVADDKTTPKSIRDDVNSILVETKRAGTLTSQLLMFAKQQVPPTEVIDLNEVVHDIGKAARKVIPDRVEYAERVSTEPTLVAVNRSRLEQVVMNLLLNARDAISGKGVILVHTRHLPAHVSLVVTDNGSGMTEEIRSQVLKAFFTTKAEQGSGLGLSTVNAIVTDACGTLSIASVPGEGTTVEINFPRAGLATSADYYPRARERY